MGTAERLDHTFLGTAVHLAGRLCDEALPEVLEAIVLRCLEKDPALRYETMQVLHDRLVNVSVRAA